MSQSRSAFGFKTMTLLFKLRDLMRPPAGKLAETGLDRGQMVLDFGCGPGSFSVEAARIVGESGRVYALDVSSHAIESVSKAAAGAGVHNVIPILSDCASGLDDQSIDVVLLYDIYHDLEEPGCVLDEIARVLRAEGIISFSDHHMKQAEIMQEMTARGRFKLTGKGKRTYSFSKQAMDNHVVPAREG